MEFTFGFLKFRTGGKKVRLCAVDGSDSAGIFTEINVAGGFTAGGIFYLAMWNLGGEKVTEIPLDETILSASVEYPRNMPSDFSVSGNTLTVRFAEEFSARFFEIKLKREDA